MSKPIRIATRSSPLALWQANAVKQQLESHGNVCELVLIESTGDINLTQPIYALGIAGVFTKELDTAILNNQADIAVHSLKDVPTQLAENLELTSVLERGAYEDVVLLKNNRITEKNELQATIATSSLRRSAQWLEKFPNHKTVPIRGNIQTRLRKFEEADDMDGIIFAKAGLERLQLLPENAVTLDWMLPAPAQGVIGIVCRKNDLETVAACQKINHEETYINAHIERQFMRALQAGCSVPVSAFSVLNKQNDEISFKGAMHSFDGKQSFAVHLKGDYDLLATAGIEAAALLLKQEGASELLDVIRNKKWSDETFTQESAGD